MNTVAPEKEKLIAKSHNKRKLGRLQKRRKIRKLKIILNRIRICAKLAFYAFIVWAFIQITTLSSWYLDENIFSMYPNSQLEIEGNRIISTQQIMDNLKKVNLPQKPLYLIDTTPIETRLLQMAPAKKAVARRYWLPARLRIVIDERTPVISILPSPKAEPVAVFTRDDDTIKVLEGKFLPIPDNFPTYKVITFDEYKKWKPAIVPYLEKLAIYLESMTGDKLVYLDIRNPDDVFAQMQNIRLRIGGVKGKEVFSRIEKVSSVIPEAMKIKDSINYIDLRWNNISIKLKKTKTEKTPEENPEKIPEENPE